MSSQPVEANVVLTADNTQYNQAMDQSTQSTNRLGASLDGLGRKMSGLVKTAGKIGLGIGASDIALITGATAAWASYEKQVSRLESQAAVLTRTQSQQKMVMKDYGAAVKSVRMEFGSSTSEAAKLVEILSKVTNVRQSRGMTDLSKVFMNMSKATGESSEGLAGSMVNLQKVMGTDLTVRNTKKYADQFTYLAAQTNTSAQGLVDFTAQLAPIGRAIGMKTEEVAGFATAFTRAGADGTQVATVFNKVATDIARSVASGSPEMRTYANLIGVTAKNFQEMSGSEQIVRVLERLKEMGPRAATELERIGLEGPRSIRAITQVVNEAGGVRQALGMAEDPRAKGSTDRGAAAAHGMSDEIAKLRQEVEGTAEAFGHKFAPILESFISVLNKVMSVVQKITDGPIGDFLTVISTILSALTSGVGVLLLFAGALLKVAAAFAVFRNSAAYGLREGYGGGSKMIRAPDGSYIPAKQGGYLGDRGEELARGAQSTDPRTASSYGQRGLYNVGQTIGSGLKSARTGVYDAGVATRRFFQPDYNPDPAVQRSFTSLAAGGAGRFLQTFINPQFDQMARQNAAFRQTWLSAIAPNAMPKERRAVEAAMGKLGTADEQLRDLRQQKAQITRDPNLLNKEREQQLARNKQLIDETKIRRDSFQELTKQTQAQMQKTQAHSDALAENARRLETGTVGTKRLSEGLREFAGHATRAVGGGMMAAGRATMASPMKFPIAGMMAMGAAGALGVESNAINMGAMGLMFGPGGAAVGAGIGLGIDTAKANDKPKEAFDNVIRMSKEGSTSFNEMQKTYKDGVKENSRTFQALGRGPRGDYSGTSRFSIPGGNPFTMQNIAYIPGLKNAIEGILGDSDVDELKQGQKEAKRRLVGGSEDTARALAFQSGNVITGTPKQQRAKLQQFMEGPGSEMLDRAGVDFETLVGLKTGDIKPRKASPLVPDVLAKMPPERGQTFDDVMDRIAHPGRSMGLDERISRFKAGAIMVGTPSVQASEQKQGNIGLYMKASDDFFSRLDSAGLSLMDIVDQTNKIMSEAGVEGGRKFEIAQATNQLARQAIQNQLPSQGRVGQFQGAVELSRIAEKTPMRGMTESQMAQVRGDKQAGAQAFVDMDQYFRQLLLAQEAYERNRKRQQDAYHLQRSYQEQDYQLARARAEEAFERQRRRAIADYFRGVARAHHDFNLQRTRAEADFNHSVEVMAKQQAQSMYNVYERVQAQRTTSAEYILANANDQLARMQQQEKNLKDLRARGLSNTAIQQLGLTDPKNAQQLARFVTEITPQMIKEFNKTAGTERVKAAKALVTDPSSLEWIEMRRSFHLNMDRAGIDFRRQMAISHEDFMRGLKQMKTDFTIMLSQQAEDNVTMMGRQEAGFKLVMDQAAEDMAHMADEITGSVAHVLKRATTELTGSAARQAAQVAETWETLSTSTEAASIKLVSRVAKIFGFDYTPPKFADNAPKGTPPNPSKPHTPAPGSGGNLAAGGVLPGYTPGQDVHHFTSQTAGDLHLSGGEGIMVPEWVKAIGGPKGVEAMNKAARQGTFASGGVFWPVPGRRTSTYSGHDGVDINRGAGADDLGDPIRAFRAGRITYVGYGHGYGQAIFENTKAGNVVYGHTSRTHVHAGQEVRAGQLIGNVGGTGNASAPHLHFGIPGGTYAQAIALLNGAIIGGFRGVVAAGISGQDPYSLLKPRYPKAEEAASQMAGVHPLKPGQISQLINRYARMKIAKLTERFGSPAAAGAGTAVDIGNEPSGHLNNERIVHTGANRMGWGDQWNSLRQLVMHESGFRNTAQNPGSSAYGMFQFLDRTWAGVGGHKTADPWLQTQYGLRYIKNVYGNPNHAWHMWESRHPHWYGDGAVFDGAQTIGVGESGPEAVIPLNAKGADFMTEVMGATMGGRNVTPAGRGGVSVYNTRVDHSTNFTGPITVQANNPQELIAKMQARQRVLALTRSIGSAA